MSVVLHVRVEPAAKTTTAPRGYPTVVVTIPDRHPGQSGQLTDWQPPGGQILLFSCQDDGAMLQISRKGATIEHPGVVIEGGVLTELLSAALQTVALLRPGETHRRRFTTKGGPADLVLTCEIVSNPWEVPG